YDVDAGAVLVDGHDVRDVTLASLRRQIAVVTQDTVLFHDTVAGNIAYAMPGATRADVMRVASAANAHDFIQRMPQGYDTQIGERGMRLSGGERQRLAIARALLRDAPILILDEATSALDTASEALVQDAIQKLMAGRTTIVIAHRLSTVRNADTILVLDRGRVVERGTHEELLRAGKLYARMWGLQGKE
ncbi:MAG: ATP-binding cassette, subfamily B, bacterial MsbA, partial [Alphaproteobacteria bacterium]